MNNKANTEKVKQLQKINQTIERAKNGVGAKVDTFTFRRKIEADLVEGKNLVRALDISFGRDRENSLTSKRNEAKMLRQYDKEKERFETLLAEVTKQMRCFEPINDGTTIEDPNDDYNNNNNNNNDDDDNTNNENKNENEFGVKRTQTQSLKSLGLEVLDSHLSEIEDKNQKVEKIAQDVKDIKEAFEDLNELVDSQQEDINIIQTNVEKTKENVTEGSKHLEVAEEHQKSSRRKQCCILIALLIIIGIIVALILCLGGGNVC